MAYPGYNHQQPAYGGGYNQPQYHGYNRPHYYQQPYGTHSLRPSNPYNTHPSYGTPTTHYANSNQQLSPSKPNQHQEGTNAAPIKGPAGISHGGQVYHHPSISGNPVAVSGWYPVQQGKSTFSNVLTGGLGLAAGAAIANSLSKPRPSHGYHQPYYGSSYSNYGRPSLSYGHGSSYGRPGNGFYKPSYKPSYGHNYGYNHPGYGGYRRPVYY